MEGGIKESLTAIRKARILFGHQSVGQDILDGLEELSKREGVPLRLAPLDKAGEPVAGIVHFRVGKNRDPGLKCRDFLRQVEASGSSYDVAVMKLCYVDVSESTDVEAVFHQYRELVGRVRATLPSLILVHATLPLKSDPPGLAAKAKRLLGRDPGNDADNVKRNEFNRRLLDAYAGEPIFDIAKVESTLPDGSRSSFRRGGTDYHSMAGAYTYDGGHLNAEGKIRVASEFVRILASAVKRKKVPA